MKIIVSHDVDHLTVTEHWRDLIVPKFVVRSLIESGLGHVSMRELGARLKMLWQNKWQNLDELARFDRELEIPSTFFFGVANGRGLTYSLKQAASWIDHVADQGFDVGVHGIAYDDWLGVQSEHRTFVRATQRLNFGIRMHYLKHSRRTLHLLEMAGYRYDTSALGFKNPFKLGRLWEFPLQVMDAYVFLHGTRWQNQSLEQAQAFSLRALDHAMSSGLRYFNILFHDLYFNDSFKSWKTWYTWFMQYLKDGGFEFTDYASAVQDMNEASVTGAFVAQTAPSGSDVPQTTPSVSVVSEAQTASTARRLFESSLESVLPSKLPLDGKPRSRGKRNQSSGEAGLLRPKKDGQDD